MTASASQAARITNRASVRLLTRLMHLQKTRLLVNRWPANEKFQPQDAFQESMPWYNSPSSDGCVSPAPASEMQTLPACSYSIRGNKADKHVMSDSAPSQSIRQDGLTHHSLPLSLPQRFQADITPPETCRLRGSKRVRWQLQVFAKHRGSISEQDSVKSSGMAWHGVKLACLSRSRRSGGREGTGKRLPALTDWFRLLVCLPIVDCRS